MLDGAARGIVDLDRIRRHWPDMLRIAGSIHTGQVSAYDFLRVLSTGGNLTQLGEALAGYGRIFKTRHVLTFVDDEPYRRQIKGMRNLNEGRHDLARHVFHGRRGELHLAYHEGMEDQLGALGLVLSCITLWNTLYLDLALAGLRAKGYPGRGEVDEDELFRVVEQQRAITEAAARTTRKARRDAARRSATPPARTPDLPGPPPIDAPPGPAAQPFAEVEEW
jgi:hypothetical protein